MFERVSLTCSVYSNPDFKIFIYPSCCGSDWFLTVLLVRVVNGHQWVQPFLALVPLLSTTATIENHHSQSEVSETEYNSGMRSMGQILKGYQSVKRKERSGYLVLFFRVQELVEGFISVSLLSFYRISR